MTTAHPPHCKKSLSFGQFLRIRCISSRKQDFDRHGLVKAAHFIARGYPPRLVVQAFLKARNLDIDSTPQPDDHRSETVPNILVTTFHPSFNNLSQILRNNWDILSHSSKTREIHSSRLITARRTPPNLRSFLVRARSDYHGKDHQKHDAAIRGRTYNVCTTVHCRYCTHIYTSGQITSSVTQRQYTSKYNVSCQSSNIVYCITCKRCQKPYVGQTKRRLMGRFQDHFYKISKALLNTDMGRHFTTLDHRGLECGNTY